MPRLHALAGASAALLTLALATTLPAAAATRHGRPMTHVVHHRRPPASSIPQHNGGDHDGDNNGGPSDGDGNV